jgi:hypothetical protein
VLHDLSDLVRAEYPLMAPMQLLGTHQKLRSGGPGRRARRSTRWHQRRSPRPLITQTLAIPVGITLAPGQRLHEVSTRPICGEMSPLHQHDHKSRRTEIRMEPLLNRKNLLKIAGGCNRDALLNSRHPKKCNTAQHSGVALLTDGEIVDT